MVNTLIFWGFLNMVDFLQRRLTYFWVIMLIVESKAWRQYAFCLHTKLNTQTTFSCWGETMSVLPLTVYMDSMMNVRKDLASNCGRSSQNALIVYQLQPWLMERFSACTEVCLLIFTTWIKLETSSDQWMYLILAYSVIFFGQILVGNFRGGEWMIEEFHTLSVQTRWLSS